MSYEEEVAAGAAWLDANRPGWVDGVDLETLDMNDCARCVLGQTFPPDIATGFGYDSGLRQLTRTEDGGVRPRDFGFAVGPVAFVGDWYDLRDAWVDVITARRADAAMADRAFDALGVEG